MRKYALRTVAVCLLLSMLLGICAYAEPAVVTGNNVNVRSGPGTGYTVIDCLSQGTSVEIIDRSNSNWYKISVHNRTGYIWSSYVTITGSSSGIIDGGSGDAPGSTPANGEPGYINAMYVNVRSGPGSSYPIIGTYNSGAGLTITGSSGQWYSVVINGKNGYIFKQYVTKGTNGAVIIPETTPAPEPVETPAVSTVRTGYVNGSNVNLRSGPGSTYRVLVCLARNTKLTINGDAVNSWLPVSVNGKTGYIYSQYVTETTSATIIPVPEVTPTPVVTPEPEEDPEITPAPEPGDSDVTAYVTGDGVCFRSGPGTNYTVLATYNRGKQVILKGTNGAWSSVIADSRSGYIYSSYLSTTNPVGGSGTADPPSAVEPGPIATPAPTPEPEPEYNGYIHAQSVNIRSGPGSKYQILATLARGTQIHVDSKGSNGWYVVTANGVTGYVYSGYITMTGDLPADTNPAPTPTPVPSTPSNAGYISGNSVHFRSGPGTGYGILGTYNYGKTLTIVSAGGEWVKVIIDGTTGYIYKTYVAAGTPGNGGNGGNPGTGSGTAPVNPSGVTGKDVANYALQFVGCRYVWGGTTPDGFDCSGLVQYVYAHFGYKLKRVACDQATEGIPIDHSSMSNLLPGDLLCFYSGSDYIGHIGIYIGNGQFVHASSSTTGVIISELAGWYTDRGYVARRIIH